MRGYREWEENGEIWDEEREREKGREENRERQDEKERHEGDSAKIHAMLAMPHQQENTNKVV